MLIKVTNYCSMGCSHCMENSTVAGLHMTTETFHKALDLTATLEGLAWSAGAPKKVLLSGGECTEHPDIIEFIKDAFRRNYQVFLISNGMWLDNTELRASILRPEWKNLMIQITNDPRFYPSKPENIPDDNRLVFIPSLTKLIGLGRLKRKNVPDGIPMRSAPTSFNIRSLTRHFRDIKVAIAVQRLRANSGFSGHCSPSISSDGTLVAGESNLCFPIGNVNSTAMEITKAICDMQCNKCGLVDNLTQEQKIAIGESRIHAP